MRMVGANKMKAASLIEVVLPERKAEIEIGSDAFSFVAYHQGELDGSNGQVISNGNSCA